MPQTNNSISWIRSNLSLILAFFALSASVLGWYISYDLLCKQVTANTAAIADIRKDGLALERALSDHKVLGHPSVDEWRRMIFTEMQRINVKLDRIRDGR